MELINIIGLVCLVFVGWLFWQTRLLAETAKQATTSYAEKHGLQILTLARSSLKPSRNQRGNFCWRAQYQFEFSSDGESYYIGYIVVNGTQVISIDTPAYRQTM